MMIVIYEHSRSTMLHISLFGLNMMAHLLVLRLAISTLTTSWKLYTWKNNFRSLLKIGEGAAQSLTEITIHILNLFVEFTLGVSHSSSRSSSLVLSRWQSVADRLLLSPGLALTGERLMSSLLSFLCGSSIVVKIVEH